MSSPNQIAGLESALLERANLLAEEYRANGRRESDRLLAEATQRLHQEEERETVAAEARAERAYQQQIQAADLQLRAEADQLRQELVNAVLARLPKRLEQLITDEPRYLALLFAWLREGARAIESSELVVQFNARDLPIMRKNWARHASGAAPDKHLTLSPAPIACSGGVLLISGDGNIRVDNTFEGRMERIGERLQHAIADRLMPARTEGN